MQNQEAIQISETEYIFTEPAPTEFVVYRDGEVDHDYYREQAKRERAAQLAAIGKGALSALSTATAVIGREIGKSLVEVGKNVDMLMYDAQHGTNYHTEYHRKKREDRNRAFAEHIGLTALR